MVIDDDPSEVTPSCVNGIMKIPATISALAIVGSLLLPASAAASHRTSSSYPTYTRVCGNGEGWKFRGLIWGTRPLKLCTYWRDFDPPFAGKKR
jgi:hypothetical protein